MRLEHILDKATNKQTLTHREIVHILTLNDENDYTRVIDTARSIRQQNFQNKIFLYGFIYFSTYCRNNCSFCYYRKTNGESPRYRKTFEETVSLARQLAASGVHLIDLTMGEDLFYHGTGNYDKLSDLVAAVKRECALPVMVSPGLLPTKALFKLKKAGADWYALYQETHNKELYETLRLNQSYTKRMASKIKAQKLGYLIEEGILLGVGEDPSDIAASILAMKELRVHQARVMSLVPQRGTPLSDLPRPPELMELLTIAAMRLTMHDVLIPASLDIEGIKGLKNRLQAGANVVTSIIPPKTGLAGVSQSTLDINEGYRTVQGASNVLAELNLHPATKNEYKLWVETQLEKNAWMGVG